MIQKPKGFTFQYGYIQMESENEVVKKVVIYIPIWLYSNQVDSFSKLGESLDLHSNMVIFKSIVFLTLIFQIFYLPFLSI